MFLRRFTDFILQSRLSAMLVAFLAAFIPVIGSISIVIAALVTLRIGVVDGLLVTCAATLPFLLSYAAFPVSGDTMMVIAAIVIMVLSNVITWVLAVALRKYRSWGLTLELTALIGILAVVAVHIVNPAIQDWWQAHLSVYLAKTMTYLDAVQQDADTTTKVPAEVLNIMKRYATGFVAASILFNTLLQLLIARWWQAVMFNPRGLRVELYQIRLSYVSALIFGMILVLAFFGDAVALDTLPVLLLVFCAAGLSLLHYVIAATRFKMSLIILTYIVFIWLFPVSVVVVSLIALFDTLINVRKRFHRL